MDTGLVPRELRGCSGRQDFLSGLLSHGVQWHSSELECFDVFSS